MHCGSESVKGIAQPSIDCVSRATDSTTSFPFGELQETMATDQNALLKKN